ncbi:MAG: restriction endonuclease subunit S [Deltaproteobacteria bacterium]|nr:restriction endonuclease subunit S [Deltaproteobacteria bacterium]
MSGLNSLKYEDIPSAWRLLPVGKVLLDTQYGTNEPAVEGGNTRVVGMKDIQEGKVLTADLTSLNLLDTEKERYLLNKGDLLINRTNSYDLVGKVGIFASDEQVAFASYLVRLTVDATQTCPEYLNHWLNGYLAQTVIKRIATRAISQANVNPTEFKKHCLVPLPPLQEQTSIAFLLSTWDLAIEKTERLIAAKEKRYLWLSKKYLFGDADQISNLAKKTKWFAVPDHWEIVKIGKIAKDVSKFNGTGENIPVLSCTKYDGLVDSLTYFDKQVFSLDTSTYKVVSRGQFAYATNHIEEGSIGYQDHYDKGLVSPMYTVFETNRDVDDSYLYKVLKSVVYLHIFRANTSSSVARRGSLRWKEFAKLPIPLPPIEEQKHIAAILTATRQEIDLLKKQAEAYRRQKRGLMQKLLTGEWRVKIDEEADNG